MLVDLPSHGHILDNGAGPGKYSIELAKLGYQVTLTDLTPGLVDFAKQKVKEQGLNDYFEGFHVADAVNLSMFNVS